MVKVLLAAVAMWFSPAKIVDHAPWNVRPKQQVVAIEEVARTSYGTVYQSELFLVWHTKFWQGCADPFRFHGQRYCWMARDLGGQIEITH